MISETFFASNYTSVWRSLTPSMDYFVRRINESEYERVWPPLPSISEPSRRGLINEAAFIFFCENFGRLTAEIAAEREQLLDAAFAQSALYLNFDDRTYTKAEARECIALAHRLQTFFGSERMSGIGSVSISPEFAGCGMIGLCTGDVIKGDTLFEVKAGDRNFRSIDYRQLLLYASLRYSQCGVSFESVGVCNPRTGVAVAVPMGTFANEVAGLAPAELFERVLAALSSNFVSE